MDYQKGERWNAYPVEMLHKLFGPNRKPITYWREFYANKAKKNE